MRWIAVFLFFVSSQSWAYICSSTREVHPTRRIYSGCTLFFGTIQNPETMFLGTEEISSLDCRRFCESLLVIPVSHEGEEYVVFADLEEVRSLVRLYQQEVLNVSEVRLTSEQFVEQVYKADAFGIESIDDEILDHFFQIDVEKKTHQRDQSKVLPVNSYRKLSQEEVASIPKEQICTICQYEVSELAKEGKEIVETCCKSNEKSFHHTFCKDCLAEHYQFQQTCPTCLSKLDSQNDEN